MSAPLRRLVPHRAAALDSSALVLLPRRAHSTARAAAAVASDPQLEAPAPSLATATFDWQDPLALSASLSEDERAMYDTARSFAQAELKPGVVEASRAGTFDRGIMRAFGGLGLLGLTAPPEYGGGGAGYVAYGLCARAVEQVDSGYRSAMSVQSSLVMHPISIFGSEEQKVRTCRILFAALPSTQ